jgi:hypothetical protein
MKKIMKPFFFCDDDDHSHPQNTGRRELFFYQHHRNIPLKVKGKGVFFVIFYFF